MSSHVSRGIKFTSLNEGMRVSALSSDCCQSWKTHREPNNIDECLVSLWLLVHLNIVFAMCILKFNYIIQSQRQFNSYAFIHLWVVMFLEAWSILVLKNERESLLYPQIAFSLECLKECLTKLMNVWYLFDFWSI